MYCKRKGTTGPVFLWNATKAKNPDIVRCEMDGSDIGAPAPVAATAKAVQRKAKAAPAPEPEVAPPAVDDDYVPDEP